ncbi:MAG: hypothetical protein IJS70_04560 [Bacteroidales bacterium]|nr:hypothetical protein [Bacteroidales bacterium]
MTRKYSIIIATVLTALSLAACFRDEPIQTESAGSGIALTLDTGEMELYTKAQPAERPGDEDGAFNENRLSGNALVFFFAPNADENTPARWNRSCPIGSNPMLIDVTMADLAQMFGKRAPQAGDQATVIVVANYDGEAFDLSGHLYTKKEIKEKSLRRADLSQHPQPYFVMLSDEAIITLLDPRALTPAKATVKLRRRAAKVTFRLTIAEEIAVENYAYSTDTEGNITVNKSIEIWRPQADKMTVYSQYFLKDGNLGGTPIKVPVNASNDSLFTGLNNPYKLVETTTMVSRERKVFQLDGEGHYMQDDDGNYITNTETVDVPLFITRYNDGDNDATNDIDGPFYTYPVTWDPGVETEPFLKLIIPWESGKDGRVKYYYYKIPFHAEALEANHWYEVTLDVQILGGEEELPVPLNANYHVVDWVSGPENSTQTVSVRYLSVPVKTFSLYNREDLEIPMLSSHECEIVNVTITKPHYGSGTAPTYDEGDIQRLEVNGLDAIEFFHTLNNTTGSTQDVAPYTITFTVRHKDNHDYSAEVVIKQYPAIYIEKQAGGNAFVDGYYSLVSGGKPEQDAVSRTTSGFAHYYHYGYFSVDNGRRVTPYGNLSGVSGGTQANNNYNGPVTVPTSETENTIIHVTAFNESSKNYSYNGNTKPYIIGDPRIRFMDADVITNKTLEPYLTPGGSNSETTEWTAEQLNALMVGTNVDNIIAPIFMFASEWGRQGNAESSFQTVAKRCATYQEAGYPAGRWRLPTEAEVAFVAYLQANNFIGTLFGRGRYWISNGTAVQVSGSSVTSTGTGNSTRCVYDLWYWGADPVVEPTYQYSVQVTK